MRSFLVGGFSLFLLAPAMAQPATELLVNMRRTHQEEAAVYLRKNTVFRIEITPEGTKAYRDTEEDQLVLKELSGTTQEQEVHYSTMVPLEKLEAYTLAYNGKGYKRIQATRVDHRDDRGRNNFHDDLRIASFTLPSLTSGSIGHVAYTLEYPDARFASGHFFSEAYPTEESTLTVISDPGIVVDVRMFNVADSLVSRTETKEKGKSVQRFTMTNVPALRYEPNAPSYYYYAPHAQLVVTLPGGAKAGDPTTDLYAWYTEHIQKAFEPAPASIQALADSLTAGITDDRDRAATIYRWVQDRIQYVAIEDGMNGFIPAGPEEVCKARYGDCKGMSSLLRSLLRSAGLDAHLAWVGTRKLPYTYTNLPTTVNSDHMIVALDLADTTLFLDATSNQAAFGVPSGFIQGKEALIGIDAEHHRIQLVPVMPASYSTLRDSVSGRLDGTTFIGSGTVRYTGYHRQQINDIFRNYSLDKQMLIMRSVLMKGSNTFLLDSISVQGLDDREGPLDVHYTFRIPDLARAVGGKRYVPLTLSDPWKDLRVHVDRKLPIDISFLSTEAYRVTMELPPDTRCTGVPARFTSANQGFDADISYTEAPGTVSSETVFRTNTLLIDKELDAWRTLNTAYLKERGRSLVLENP